MTIEYLDRPPAGWFLRDGIFADYTSLVEPLSLDEAYLDVTENLRAIPTAFRTAAEIRARIFGDRLVIAR